MGFFSKFSIRHKLTAVIMATCGVILLLTCTVFVASEVITSRRVMVQELAVIAQIIGNNSTASLVFDDKKSAEETLSALQALSNVTAAYIYRDSDLPFAEYRADGNQEDYYVPQYNKKFLDRMRNGQATVKNRPFQDFRFFDDYVDLYKPIVLDGEVVGALYLRSNLKGMYSHLERYFFGVAVVTFFAFILALLLSSRLQKVISQPILALAGTMKEVSQKQNYSIRAEKHGGDEIGVLIDGFNNMLSQIQTREENLRTAQRQAEMANRTKSEFLAAMSHELRTPLNAILGFSEIMKNELMGPLGTPEYRDYAGDIHDSGTHLLEVINDILDISKIEAGKLELKEEQVSVNDLITKSVRLMKERAENAGLDIAIEIEPGLPLLFVDPRLVKQSLINLLSNAIKFTPQGGHVTVRTMKEDGGAIAMAVSDTGIGIAAEDIDHVLVPFGQVDSSLSRKYEGTGLGLPLVKSFIELHGGTLTIDSAIGLGTTVTIRFPAERAVGPGTVFKAANQ